MTQDEHDQLVYLLQEFRDELQLGYSYLDNLEIRETNYQVWKRKLETEDLRSNMRACDQLLETLEE